MNVTTPKASGIRTVWAGDEGTVERLLEATGTRSRAVERSVARIIADVRARGDQALLQYAQKFDGLQGAIEVSPDEMRQAVKDVPKDVRDAVRFAARNITTVAKKQLPRGYRVRPTPGVTIEHRVTPLERVGCYVPAGRYPLPSSLLMTAIPAKVAGVEEVVVACPRPDATIMLAAVEAGVDRLFKIGGAHAIAALAYGTHSVPRVDKIVGPGNAWVAAAKAQVARDCAIDFYAGPSEIVIVSEDGRADWIAADLIAQAEHDVDARALLLTPSRTLAGAVVRELQRQLPSRGPAADALARNGGVYLTRSLDEAIDLCERLAPEHVVCDNRRVATRIRRVGTIFIGRLSAQALGDYVTGSNHVLPTSGAARSRSGLSAADFVRLTPVQTITRAGLARIGSAGVALARAEGLQAHAASIEIRLEKRR